MLHKLPFQVLKPQSQLLIFHIPPAGKKGGVPAASLALKHIIGVRRSGNTGGAANLIERIVPVLEFSQMMDENNGNIVLICDPLNGGNVVVIVAVHSRFPGAAFGIPHLLKRVDNYQLCLREVLQEVNDFFFQPVSNQAAGYRQMETPRRIIGQIEKSVFNSSLCILQTEIQHIAVHGRDSPNG